MEYIRYYVLLSFLAFSVGSIKLDPFNTIKSADTRISSVLLNNDVFANNINKVRNRRQSEYKSNQPSGENNNRIVSPDYPAPRDFDSFIKQSNSTGFIDEFKSTITSHPAKIVKIQGSSTRNVLLKNVTRVNICCDSSNHVFNETSIMCQESSTDIVPLKFHDEHGQEVQNVVYQPVLGFPTCSFYSLSPSTAGPDDSFFLTTAGELMVGGVVNPYDIPAFSVQQGQYCLYYPQPHLLEAFVCFPEDVQANDQLESDSRTALQKQVYPVCLVISSVFLLATLAVHCLLKELREDTLSKSFMCSIAMLALAQLFMVITSWNLYRLIQTPLCLIMGSLTQFFFLSAFLWLNVICCTVLRSLWSPPNPSPISRCCGPFAWQCTYAFGIAGALSGLALCRDLLPPLYGSALPQPRFTAVSCWFSNSPALIVYLMGPISVLLGLNLLCFCLAAYKMATLQKRSHRTSSHFSQYLKLFVLMGVSWIFEVVSFFASTIYGSHPINYVWVFFDLVNILQGVLIFALFVCRPSVLRALAARLCGDAFRRRCTDSEQENGGGKHDTETAACNTIV